LRPDAANAADYRTITQRNREGEMAQKVTVALEDDLDGGPADEAVRFSFGGAAYEIDLSTKNAAAFRKQLAPFIDHARGARAAWPTRTHHGER
jgi:hypothetical protein